MTVTLLALLWGGTASAQQARVEIGVDRALAYVGEELRVEVSIHIRGRMSYERYLPPSFEGFRVLGSGMTSQNIEIVNMQVRRTESYIYTVVPVKAGILKIGPAAVVSGGKAVRSQAKKLQVKNRAARPTPSPNQPPGATGEPDNPVGNPDSDRGVLIRSVATPSRVYQGQEVLATWTLYVTGNVGLRGFQVVQQPTTDSFWSEDFNSPTRLSYEQKVVGGNIYNVALLARKKLFAQKSGVLKLGVMTANLTLVQFFNSRHQEVSSNNAEVVVLPLPKNGKPAGFVPGNVGRYDLSATLDRDQVKGGDAVTLTVVVRGEGNLRQLKVPPLAELPGFKVYEPKVTDNLELGEKKLEYLLMPTKAGRLQLPSIQLPTFDPQTAKYRLLKSRPMSLMVTGPMPQALDARKDPRKNVLGPTIRPPRPPQPLSHQQSFRPLASTVIWATLLLPLIMLGLVSGAERLRTQLKQETPRRLQRAASRRNKEHLKRARELARQDDKAAFFGELAAAMGDLLDHKLTAKVEGLTRPELGKLLQGRGFAPELVIEVMEELDNCDFARFTPSASDAREMERTLVRARKLLDRINRVKVRPSLAGEAS